MPEIRPEPGASGRLRALFLLLALVRLLVPARLRDRWVREWRAELLHAQRAGSLSPSRCLVAIPHAVALRWQEHRTAMSPTDLRFAFRQLLKSPASSIAIIVTLALGIGGNALVFSVLSSTVLRPLPYRDADRIVYLWRINPASTVHVSPSGELVRHWREHLEGLESVEAVNSQTRTLTGRGEPARIGVAAVSPTFFRFLGIAPERGRAFTQEEALAGNDKVALLSDAFWRQRFGGADGVLGDTVLLDDTPYTVIGVLPHGVHLQSPYPNAEVWTPLAVDEPSGAVFAMGRLRPGVTLALLNEELAAVGLPAGEELSDWPGRAATPRDFVRGAYRSVVWSVQGAVLFVLLIAGANTANLLLARGSSRRRELAIRAALGAGRGRLLRQLLGESILLAAAAGIAGVAVAWLGVRAIGALTPADVNYFETVRLDRLVVVATLGLSLLTGFVFGLLPALQVSARRLSSDLADGARGTGEGSGGRLRRALVGAEVSLTALLLIGAALLVRSFLVIQGIDPGFDPRGVLAVRVALPDARYTDAASRREFFDQLQRRVRVALAGRASSVAIADGVPPKLGVYFGQIETADGPPRPAEEDASRDDMAAYMSASPEIFAALGIPFHAGAPYPEAAAAGPTPVVINEGLAHELWPDGDAVGRRFRYRDDEDWLQVSGVAGDVKSYGLLVELTNRQIYALRGDGASAYVVVRTGNDPLALAPIVRDQVRSLDAAVPITEVTTAEELMSGSIALQRFNAGLMVACALLALSLALVGVYGVLSYSVARRTSEIGLRMALGASPGQVLRLVTREGLLPVAGGLLPGLLAAIWLTRLIRSQLHGVEPLDPLAFAAAAALLLVAGVAACLVPAARATRVDPLVALRRE